MIKHLWILILLHCLAASSHPILVTETTLDDHGIFNLLGLRQLSDSSRIICIKMEDPDPKTFIVKTDKFGNFLWIKKFYSSNIDSMNFPLNFTTTAQDEIFITGGFENYIVPGNTFIIKMNKDGNVLWTRKYKRYIRFPDTSYISANTFGETIEIVQGEIILSGYGLLLKLNGQGDIIWSDGLGFKFDSIHWGYLSSEITSSLTLPDKSIICGSTVYGNSYFRLLKFDSTGVSLIQKRVQPLIHANHPEVQRVQLLPNGNIAILVQTADSFSSLMICDTALNVIYSKYYNRHTQDMIVTPSGNIKLFIDTVRIVIPITSLPTQLRILQFSPSLDKISEQISYSSSRTYFIPSEHVQQLTETNTEQLAYAVIGGRQYIPLLKLQFIITDSAGISCYKDSLPATDSTALYSDSYLVTNGSPPSDSLTYFDDSFQFSTPQWQITTTALSTEIICNDTMFTSIKDLTHAHRVTIFPNPFTDEINIDLPASDIDFVILYNINGEIVKKYIHPGNKLALNDLSNGMYLMEISINGEIDHLKIIKQTR